MRFKAARWSGPSLGARALRGSAKVGGLCICHEQLFVSGVFGAFDDLCSCFVCVLICAFVHVLFRLSV